MARKVPRTDDDDGTLISDLQVHCAHNDDEPTSGGLEVPRAFSDDGATRNDDDRGPREHHDGDDKRGNNT